MAAFIKKNYNRLQDNHYYGLEVAIIGPETWNLNLNGFNLYLHICSIPILKRNASPAVFFLLALRFRCTSMPVFDIYHVPAIAQVVSEEILYHYKI